MKTRTRKGLALAGIVLAAAGCQDLTVPNPNNPDIDRILQDPADVEALVGASWRPYWNYTNGILDASIGVSAMSEEFTSTATNGGMLDLSSEPRRAFNNDPAYANRFVNQGPWYAWYGAISNANAGLSFVSGTAGRAPQKVVVGGVDRTARVKAFAKYMQGLLHSYFAMYYDRAYVASETLNLQDEGVVRGVQLQPYTTVRDSAVAMLEQAARFAAADTFTLPTNWINGLTIRNTDLRRLANSYAARALVYSARTPQERAAVDWQKVIGLVDAGITADHAPTGEIGVLESSYKRFAQWRTNAACDQGTTIQTRADYRLIGPADTSGAYQRWVDTPVEQRTRFNIATPDRRITGTTPTSNGSYFRYCSSNASFNAGRGTYHFSAYQWDRLGGRWREGALPIVTKAEMDLLKAEGLLRTGNPAGAAALINVTRTTNGRLPAVTAAGVPQSTGCVPRNPATGACGTLMEALMYEKGIEGAGVDAFVHWFDMRGWGQLPQGTPLHFPVPGRELFVINEPLYTFGGSGPGSAP